jgi:2-phosphosulfolactate phosphatase
MDGKNNIHNINCEWGLKGIEKFKRISDAIIIVDVLSFSTSVDIALGNEAVIFPYRFKDETSYLYARQVHAELASFSRSKDKYSLSPESLTKIEKGTKLILPSPNGAELALSTGSVPTLCACLRNCKSVAEYAMSLGENILVIPTGEKWEDGSHRFAVEDCIGAGAVISFLKGNLSAESKTALHIFNSFKDNLFEIISACVSGAALIKRGFEEDITLACQFNVSKTVPVLEDNSFRNRA